MLIVVEDNYLSTTEKSRQTELNYKQNLTSQEKQERDALNRKDSDSDMAVYLACNKGGGDCQAERAKAKEAQDTYFNQTYLNPKEAQAGYKQIENLLESTDPNAKEVFNILDGYTQAFMTFGYTEEEARARAGTYVGSIYVLGGMSAVLSSNSLTKQFGKDVAADAKPSGNTTPKIDAGKGSTKLDIKQLPDTNGKAHATAVKGDAHVPVDKVELYMRGKASGIEQEAILKEYNALRELQNSNQKEFAKNGQNIKRLEQLKPQIKNITKSQNMASVLDKAGIPRYSCK